MADRYGYIGIETLLNFCEKSKDHSITPNDIMMLKRVSVPHWIPVDERLPEPNQLVGKVSKYYLIQDEYGDMLTASYNRRADGFIYWEQMYDIEPLHYDVVAWAELPKPYERRE